MTRRALCLTAIAVCSLSGPAPAQERTASNHVIMLGTIKVKPGREDDFKKVLAEMSARMRREDHGNVRFEFYSAAPGRGQDATASPTWYEYEEWEDQAAFTAHGRWAGPMIQTTWKELTESAVFVRLTPMEFK